MNYILMFLLSGCLLFFSGCEKSQTVENTDHVQHEQVQAFSGLAIVTEPVEQLSQIESE